MLQQGSEARVRELERQLRKIAAKLAEVEGIARQNWQDKITNEIQIWSPRASRYPCWAKTVDTFTAPTAGQMTVGTVEIWATDSLGERIASGLQVEAFYGAKNSGDLSSGLWVILDLVSSVVTIVMADCEP